MKKLYDFGLLGLLLLLALLTLGGGLGEDTLAGLQDQLISALLAALGLGG